MESLNTYNQMKCNIEDVSLNILQKQDENIGCDNNNHDNCNLFKNKQNVNSSNVGNFFNMRNNDTSSKNIISSTDAPYLYRPERHLHRCVPYKLQTEERENVILTSEIKNKIETKDVINNNNSDYIKLKEEKKEDLSSIVDGNKNNNNNNNNNIIHEQIMIPSRITSRLHCEKNYQNDVIDNSRCLLFKNSSNSVSEEMKNNNDSNNNNNSIIYNDSLRPCSTDSSQLAVQLRQVLLLHQKFGSSNNNINTFTTPPTLTVTEENVNIPSSIPYHHSVNNTDIMSDVTSRMALLMSKRLRLACTNINNHSWLKNGDNQGRNKSRKRKRGVSRLDRRQVLRCTTCTCLEVGGYKYGDYVICSNCGSNDFVVVREWSPTRDGKISTKGCMGGSPHSSSEENYY